MARSRTNTRGAPLPPQPFVSNILTKVTTKRNPGEAHGTGKDKRRCSTVVPRAFLGVGAPELVLVGVVALVLFGPKGLAQAAKSFGQVVKSVAPTLRELTDISTDLKSTIEDEIGLSEIRSELESTLSPLQSATMGRSGREPAAQGLEADPDIEAKRAASLRAAWGASEGGNEAGGDPEPQSSVDALSTEELERIIAARKAAESGGEGKADAE